MTASGSVSDFDEAKKTSLRTSIAVAGSVDASAVTVTVAAASVLITATIAVPASTTAAAVQTSLSSTLGTAADASAALGVTIESAPTVALVEAEDSTSESSGDGVPVAAIIGAAVGALVLLVGTLLGVGTYRGWYVFLHLSRLRWVPAQKNVVLAGAGTGEKESGGEVALGEADNTAAVNVVV